MNPNVFSLRKLICYAALACSSTFALMGTAAAAETPDGYVTDSLVGQSNTNTVDEDRTTDGWLHSVVGQQVRSNSREAALKASSARYQASADAYRDAQGRADKFARTEPFIRDALIGQVPGAVSGADPGPAVQLTDSDTDWVVLAGGLLLAFLMGIAGTLAVEYLRDMRHRTA